MNKYHVWTVNSTLAGATIVAAASSFEARQVCARAWGKDITDVMARRTDLAAPFDGVGFLQRASFETEQTLRNLEREARDAARSVKYTTQAEYSAAVADHLRRARMIRAIRAWRFPNGKE